MNKTYVMASVLAAAKIAMVYANFNPFYTAFIGNSRRPIPRKINQRKMRKRARC